jgi:hypothetical protein
VAQIRFGARIIGFGVGAVKVVPPFGCENDCISSTCFWTGRGSGS